MALGHLGRTRLDPRPRGLQRRRQERLRDLQPRQRRMAPLHQRLRPRMALGHLGRTRLRACEQQSGVSGAFPAVPDSVFLVISCCRRRSGRGLRRLELPGCLLGVAVGVLVGLRRRRERDRSRHQTRVLDERDVPDQAPCDRHVRRFTRHHETGDCQRPARRFSWDRVPGDVATGTGGGVGGGCGCRVGTGAAVSEAGPVRSLQTVVPQQGGPLSWPWPRREGASFPAGPAPVSAPARPDGLGITQGAPRGVDGGRPGVTRRAPTGASMTTASSAPTAPFSVGCGGRRSPRRRPGGGRGVASTGPGVGASAGADLGGDGVHLVLHGADGLAGFGVISRSVRTVRPSSDPPNEGAGGGCTWTWGSTAGSGKRPEDRANSATPWSRCDPPLGPWLPMSSSAGPATSQT